MRLKRGRIERKCEGEMIMMRRRRMRREAKAFGQSQDRLQMLSPSLPLSLSFLTVIPFPLSSHLQSPLFLSHPLSHPFPSNLTLPPFIFFLSLLLIHPQRRNNVGQCRSEVKGRQTHQTFAFSSEGKHQQKCSQTD